MLVSGSAILCGEYMGRNQQDRLHNTFSIDLLISLILGLVFGGILLLAGLLDLTSPLTTDPSPESGMGIRLVFSCASEIKYQSILGLNALTIWLRN